MARAVPNPPFLARASRRLARLPAGGATGVACAIAGMACAVGVIVVQPQLSFSPDGRSRDTTSSRPVPPIPAKPKASANARLTGAGPAEEGGLVAVPDNGGPHATAQPVQPGGAAVGSQPPASSVPAASPPPVPDDVARHDEDESADRDGPDRDGDTDHWHDAPASPADDEPERADDDSESSPAQTDGPDGDAATT